MKHRAASNQIALHFVLLSVCQAPAGVNTKANPKLSLTRAPKYIPRLSARLTRPISVSLLSFIRSWTGKETMTRTSSRPPTLGFVRPSSRMRRRTPLCLPEHSRTKPSTCTGSRRNARRAARVCQRAAHRRSNGRSRRQRLEGVLHRCWSPGCPAASCDAAYYF